MEAIRAVKAIDPLIMVEQAAGITNSPADLRFYHGWIRGSRFGQRNSKILATSDAA